MFVGSTQYSAEDEVDATPTIVMLAVGSALRQLAQLVPLCERGAVHLRRC